MYQNLNKLCYLFFTILSTLSYNAFSQVNVTFKVDMQYQTVSETGVHIAGSFQDWDPGSTPLTDDDGDNIWEVVYSIDANTNHNYKFINGNYWGADESVYGDCGNGDRILSVGDQDMILPAYVFNSCAFTAYGCTDANAINYDSSANNDDGSCEYPPVEGCTDSSACNYDENAVVDTGCVYPEAYSDCNGCINDSDGDGICDEVEVAGCTDNLACNYDSLATDEDNTCNYPITFVGNDFISWDNNGNGYINVDSYPNNPNNTGSATLILNGDTYQMLYGVEGNNARWYYMIEADIIPTVYTWEVTVSNDCGNGDIVTGSFTSQVFGCTDDSACNYNSNATSDNGTCVYPETGFDCDGNVLNPEGCTYSNASNYNSNAFIDDGSCLFELIEDLDGDGHDDDSFSAGVLSVECPEIIESCLGDLDNDGTIATNDLLVFLGQFGFICE